MSGPLNPNDARLPDVESLLAQLINSRKHLLQAQVILSDQQDRSGQLFARLVESVEGTERRLGRLAEQTELGFTRLTEKIAQLAEKIEQLTDGQKHSADRLNALISVVDDLLHKNGKRDPN